MSIKASFSLSAVKLQSAVVMRQQVTQLVELVFPRMSCVCVCVLLFITSALVDLP